ncbi:uncharacterized protein [Antedon mediterranea]|uniref:uncharacterized protein n=1 Tax=Antedon mediterranea TaxID=105859 RepID=UPI003AF65604
MDEQEESVMEHTKCEIEHVSDQDQDTGSKHPEARTVWNNNDIDQTDRSKQNAQHIINNNNPELKEDEKIIFETVDSDKVEYNVIDKDFIEQTIEVGGGNRDEDVNIEMEEKVHESKKDPLETEEDQQSISNQTEGQSNGHGGQSQEQDSQDVVLNGYDDHNMEVKTILKTTPNVTIVGIGDNEPDTHNNLATISDVDQKQCKSDDKEKKVDQNNKPIEDFDKSHQKRPSKLKNNASDNLNEQSAAEKEENEKSNLREQYKIENTEQNDTTDICHPVDNYINCEGKSLKELPNEQTKTQENGQTKTNESEDDNDSGNENGEKVDENDDDIEALQKLIEDQHLAKSDTQDLSETELNDQDNQLEKPYYDRVPSIFVARKSNFKTNRPSIAHIPSPSLKWNSIDERLSTRQSVRLPPAVVKMTTKMTSAKKRRAAVIRSVSQYYEVKKQAKLLRWDECANSRPPLPIDLDLPGPWHYSPSNKPLYETNAPEYSFGMRFYERGGGARTAHAKPWFNSNSNFTTKVNFEKRWPSPAQYCSKPLLGRRNHTLPDFPVYSIGVRSKFAINKKGSESEPSPNEYYPDKSHSLPNAPAYSFGSRHLGTCISIGDTDPNNPGPANYSPRIQHMKPHRPSFTIKGIRIPKSHMLGPHATL